LDSDLTEFGQDLIELGRIFLNELFDFVSFYYVFLFKALKGVKSVTRRDQPFSHRGTARRSRNQKTGERKRRAENRKRRGDRFVMAKNIAHILC
jgi:hypothetical protein